MKRAGVLGLLLGLLGGCGPSAAAVDASSCSPFTEPSEPCPCDAGGQGLTVCARGDGGVYSYACACRQ